MDSIKAEKRRAINSYKQNYKSTLHQFFYSLIVHSLIAITCSLICSYSYWFPSLYTIKHLLFMSLPNSFSSFFNPTCLFIVANFIVVFLIGESRLSGKQSSPATEMYQEYVERRRSLRRPPSTFQVKKEETILPAMSLQNDDINAKRIEDKEVDQSKEDKHDEDDDEDFKECEENGEDKKDEGKKEEEEKQEEKEAEKQEEEEAGIPAQELNKRVEDFIARVNKQRWLEARFVVCR